MTPAVSITAPSPKGHRRAGVRHPTTPVLHPPGTFTDDDIQALRDDPRLLVEVVGGLAMGVLAPEEIAATMGGDTATGGMFSGWEIRPGTQAVMPAAIAETTHQALGLDDASGGPASEDEAFTSAAPAVSIPAEPSPPGAAEKPDDTAATDDPPARPARAARKPKEA
mgnify:FL=1